MQRAPVRRLPVALAALLAALLAAGCQVAPPRPGPAVEQTTVNAAQAQVTAGHPEAAAQVYLNAAGSAAAPQALEYRLRAARLLLNAGNLQRAATVLAGLPEKVQAPGPALRLQLLRAHLSLARHKPRAALRDLQTPPPEGEVPDALRNRYHGLRAQAYAMAGNHLESARERVWLDPMLPNADARRANETALWEQLSQLSDQALQQLSKGPPDVLSGWMDLVHLTRTLRQQPAALEQAIARWRQRYPDHPADHGLLSEVLKQLAKTRQPPAQIALLLPLSGRLSAAADAVRDGFLAGYFHQPAGVQRPVIRIYDTGDQAGQAWALYQQAVAEGAKYVVGPLDKTAVADLARSGTLSVPLLTLNYLDNAAGTAPAGMYQFGLSPEDEARAVADRARQDGHGRCVTLVPQGTWGQRVLSAFQQRWQSLGGTIAENQTYDPQQTDYSDALTHMLNLDGSHARYRALARRLPGALHFQPRRRRDVDFVFLVAQPRQARLIRPQLRFHHAGDLPVYATSHVYGGEPDQVADRDMDGIRFCDMPWALDDSGPLGRVHDLLDRLWPQRTQRYSRLYALGLDAYDVLPYLHEMGRGGTLARFDGATGNLRLDSDHRLHRRLRWAHFVDGLAKPLPASTDAGAGPDATGEQQTGTPAPAPGQ